MAPLYTSDNFTRRVIQVFSIPGSPDGRVRKTQIKYELLATKAGKIDWNAHPTGAFQPLQMKIAHQCEMGNIGEWTNNQASLQDISVLRRS